MKFKHLIISVLASLSLMNISTHASGLVQYEAKFVTSTYAKTKYPLLMVHGFGLGFLRIGTEKFWTRLLVSNSAGSCSSRCNRLCR